MIKINKAGYLYTILTILIGFSAVNSGNNLVYMIASALLSYMLASGLFGRRNIQKIAVSLQLPREVYAGTEVPIGVEVHNLKKWMPGFLIAITIDGQRAFFPFIEPGARAVQPLAMRFERRGRHRTGEVIVSSVFPFNFFTRFRKAGSGQELIVFPMPRKCAAIAAEARPSRVRGERVSSRLGFDSDIVSIRDYISGDPPKYINWKSTAKTGELKTKELSATEVQNLLIDFDRLSKTDLEQTISCVAFLILRCLKTSVPVGLTIDGETLRPETGANHKAKLLARLACYGQD